MGGNGTFLPGPRPGHAVEPELRLTLRPRGGLPMTLERAA